MISDSMDGYVSVFIVNQLVVHMFSSVITNLQGSITRLVIKPQVLRLGYLPLLVIRVNMKLALS